jgi:mannose-6-phosphate isomerase-like protein (cupin superfamily)
MRQFICGRCLPTCSCWAKSCESVAPGVNSSHHKIMKAGQTVGNRQTGETLTMLVSEEENGGARQLYEVHIPPRRASPPLHYHLAFTETFRVLQGALDLYVGRERRHFVLTPQESLTAQIGQLHTFANERDSPAVITIETKPAGGVVQALQLAYGVANDGGAARDGLPGNPIARLVFIRMSEGFLPRIPIFVQKAVFGVAAILARWTGLEKRLMAYL